MARSARRAWLLGAAVAVLAVAGVLAGLFLTPPRTTAPRAQVSGAPTSTASGQGGSSPAPSGTTAAPEPTGASQAPASNLPSMGPGEALAAKTLAAMTLEQRVGQLFMVAAPVTGLDAASTYALGSLPVGNVFMKGRTTAGLAGATAQVSDAVAHVAAARAEGVRPFVATDQEGGLVQVMQGPGFDAMPQALEQGQLALDVLAEDATRWGRQLAAAGVNVNLAPVLDTVPGEAFAPQNAPIGAFGREYGYTPAAVSEHGLAFARGMQAAGVATVPKHFPGLGRVTANTDVAAGVTDSVTTRHDAYVQPFRDAVDAGVGWLMVSNAYYPKIDAAQLAPFSAVVLQGMIRSDLGFGGIIISDDICDAVQVAGVPVAQRGVDFLAAGGTMALCTNASLAPAMYNGLVSAAKASPAVARQVDAAALLVLRAKAAAGLIGG